MAKMVAKADPALSIDFFLSGFYTYRSQLFAPFKPVGVNVISFHDPVLDGENMEDTDLYEWQRRPGYSKFCPTQLGTTEVVNQFYSSRNLNGIVTAFFDSTVRLSSFTNLGISDILTKTTTAQGYISTIGNMTYISDGASLDMQKWGSPNGSQAAPLLSAWGLAGPNTAPTIFNLGCWLPTTYYNAAFQVAIQDPNGNIQVISAPGISGINEPLWSTTLSAVTTDGQLLWTNYGPILAWAPVSYYPTPAVILDTNGNLQLATTAANPIPMYVNGNTYTQGMTVEFNGTPYTATATSTGIAPNPYSTSTTGGVTTSYWIPASSPIATGTAAPVWNPIIGGTTADGDYTWINIGQGTLIETVGTSYVYGYRTIYGHLSTCSPVSVNTGSIFGPQTVAVTGFSISGNVVTFFGVNNMSIGRLLPPTRPGNIFTVQGLTSTIGMTLNNKVFVVTAGGGLSGSTTFFAARYIHANTGGTIADSGVTVDLVAQVTGVGTASPLCNSVATITAASVSGNIVTIYAVNNFVPGLYVTLAGLTTLVALNNQIPFQVINVDPLGLWFQIYFVTPNQVLTPDTGTATFDAVEIYRTSDGGGTFLFTGAVVNPGAGVPWNYYDFTIDADLDILEIAPQNNLNDPPPGAPGSTVMTPVGTITRYWQGRLWMVVGNFVYFDAGPDCNNGIPEESWPPANRFQWAGPVLGIEPTADEVGLLVYLADRVGVILGGPETISFYPSDLFTNFGISNPNAIFRDGSVIGQFTTQKQYFELIEKTKENVGQHIGDYLSTHFSPTKTYTTMHRDGLDVGMFLSNGVDQVLRYGTNIEAWSVPAFPAGGAGAIQSVETSVGIYSLMLASPTGGGYLLARDLATWQDGGTPGGQGGTNYDDCFITIGNITLSQPGAPMFPLQHVVGYFDGVGTLNNGGPSLPAVWILPNEIKSTTGIGFIFLPEITQEPPIGQTNPSTTLLALRWNVSMMNSSVASQFVHHLQVRIEFQPENAPNTIKALSFKEYSND